MGTFPKKEPPLPLLWIVKRTDRNAALKFGSYRPPFGTLVSYDGDQSADFSVEPAATIADADTEFDEADCPF